MGQIRRRIVREHIELGSLNKGGFWFLDSQMDEICFRIELYSNKKCKSHCLCRIQCCLIRVIRPLSDIVISLSIHSPRDDPSS